MIGMGDGCFPGLGDERQRGGLTVVEVKKGRWRWRWSGVVVAQPT